VNWWLITGLCICNCVMWGNSKFKLVCTMYCNYCCAKCYSLLESTTVLYCTVLLDWQIFGFHTCCGWLIAYYTHVLLLLKYITCTTCFIICYFYMICYLCFIICFILLLYHMFYYFIIAYYTHVLVGLLILIAYKGLQETCNPSILHLNDEYEYAQWNKQKPPVKDCTSS